MCGGAANAEPGVVRVRVPAKDVTKYFPAGTGLRILSPQEFESRVQAAGRGPAEGRPNGRPRLVRARHRARWEAGLLRGRSELVVGGGTTGPVEFPLEPWTPAVLVEAGAAPAAGSRDSGSGVLRIAASPREQALTIDWEQQPRPHSRGRGFSLGLPAVDTTTLELELPRGWTASSQRGVRRGPMPANDPAASLWEVDGEAGRFDVELRDPAERLEPSAGAGAWMSTTTEVDLRRTPELAGSMINWIAIGRLDLDPRHAGALEAELDPGLELIDVRGDAVQGYRTERSGESTRVAVRIAEGVRATTLSFLAHASVPSEGTWAIPSIRPMDATWTGGRTTVTLDELHAVREYRERAGRLVPPGRGEAGTAHRMAFEADSPRSVAELDLVRPRSELACTVRGQLNLGVTPARLDCRLDCSVHRGSVSHVEVDLSPAWFPEQVWIPGLDDPLAWHSSPLPSGATRLRVMLPASVLAAPRWMLAIGASSHATASRGPLELPRVRPVGSAVVDEAWLAWADDGTTIQPTRARGLAWLDPAEVSGLVGRPPSPGLRQALAWRWTTEAAEARIDRERIDREPWASIHARARLAPDGKGLSIEGTLEVAAGAAALDVLPVWVDAPGDPMASWRFRGDDDGELRLLPLEAATRARLEVPGSSSARALRVGLPPQAKKTVTFRASLPWSSPGVIPLLRVPGDYFKQGTVRLETPAGMKSSVRATSLGRLHQSPTIPSSGGPARAGIGPQGGQAPRDRVVHAYAYTEANARLELVAAPMTPSPTPGIVRDALLTTTWDGRGRTLNRLRLQVQVGTSESLSLELPEGASVARVRQDGADVTPIRSADRLTMPAPAPPSGARSSVVVIDYAMEPGRLGDGSILRPDRPRLELPCLSFTWEVSVPHGWRVLDPGPGLVAGDPDDPAGWPCGALGLRVMDWPSMFGPTRMDPADRLGQLDGRLGRPAPENLSFAEWFSRWDSGPWSIVVDRLAMGAAGLGPRSTCFPVQLPVDRRDSARAILQQQGLAVVPFPDALLVTTETELPRFERPGPWLDAIAEALAWGSDRGDRFQSVGRWRGETTPRAVSAADQSARGTRPLPGREIRRFSASNWPEAEAFVHLVDARRQVLIGWIVAGLLAVAWLSTCGRASGRLLSLPALVAAASVLLEGILPARYDALTAGGFAGSIAILIAGLARRTRREAASSPPPARTESSLIRGAARAATGSAMLIAVAVAMETLQAAPAGPDAPIVALFPYEGAFDPEQPPDRVLLRLEDFRRLDRRAGDAAAADSTVTAVAAGHRVSRKDGSEILVETEIELAARGPGPFAWRIPVTSSREISATLGGQAVPIAVEPGGDRATIALPKAGNYLLSLRRWTAARIEGPGVEVLVLPVNATPSARLIVRPPADRVSQGQPETRGRMERKPDGTLDGRLGPSDRIVVRWTASGSGGGAGGGVVAGGQAGPVDGLILWDVTPAGDRVRARLTFHRSDEIASVRLSHEPGVILRSVGAAGRSRVYCEDDPRNGQWVLSFEPPLPPTATLSVDCWRPVPEVRDIPEAPGVPVGRPAARERRLPLIRPVAAERFTAVLGVRRPGDWTGRLAPIRDTDPIDDEAFVKAWGTLPDDPLTLCGTSRLARDLGAKLLTGTSPTRTLIRPAVQLWIETGRIVVVADADLESSAHAPITEATLPEGMQVTQVVGDGLIDWIVSADGRIKLIWYLRESRPRRHVRILGWIPIGGDPLEVGGPPRRVRTPWVRWPGAEPGPATLSVYCATRAEIMGGAGLSPAPASAAPAPTSPVQALAAGARSAAEGAAAVADRPRLSYLVGDPASLGELAWDARPPQVSVSVESQLTIDPDFGDWVAVIRYDVLGGGLDRLNLKIPAEWAERASLIHSGEERRSSPQRSGQSAFWTIAPDRPMWGSHRFVLRSTLPIGSAPEIAYPEVAPLGREGAVDAYLRIINATGRPLAAEDATGLRRIVPFFNATRFRDREFARDVGAPAGTYRVEARSWALRIPLPRGGSGPAGVPDDAARVSMADVMLSVMSDRSVLGRVLYEIVPDSGRLLTVELPEDSTILWASIEPNPAVPLRAGPTTWSIAMDPAQGEHVCLIWRAPPSSAASTGPGVWPIALPHAGPVASRALVSVSTPAGLAIRQVPAGFQPVAIGRLDKARADGLGRSIRESLPKLDRSSGRDHERLVSMLINHGLAIRSAERAASLEMASFRGSAEESEFLGAIASARIGLEETVRSAGLPDDLASARGYLGLSPEAGNRPPRAIPELLAPCRIRAFGQPSAMIGMVTGLEEAPDGATLIIEGDARGTSLRGGGDRWVVLAAALAVAAIAAMSLDGRRAPVAAGISLVLMLAASALAGGPAMLAGALGLAVPALRRRPSPSN